MSGIYHSKVSKLVNKHFQHVITVLLRKYASMYFICFDQQIKQIVNRSVNTKIASGGVFKLLNNRVKQWSTKKTN